MAQAVEERTHMVVRRERSLSHGSEEPSGASQIATRNDAPCMQGRENRWSVATSTVRFSMLDIP